MAFSPSITNIYHISALKESPSLPLPRESIQHAATRRAGAYRKGFSTLAGVYRLAATVPFAPLAKPLYGLSARAKPAGEAVAYRPSNSTYNYQCGGFMLKIPFRINLDSEFVLKRLRGKSYYVSVPAVQVRADDGG
jgi:hypothetical protein